LVQNNGANGVTVGSLSRVNLGADDPATPGLEKNEMANNTSNGIVVGGGSNLSGSGAHKIHHNGSMGISVSGATFSLSGQSQTDRLEIYQNGHLGVALASGSGGLGRFAVIRQNNQSPPITPSPFCHGVPGGVCVTVGASLIMNETEVSQNIGHGVVATGNGAVSVSTLVVTLNTGSGLFLERGSGASFQVLNFTPTAAPTNISGNFGDSVTCDSSAWIAGNLTGIAKPVKCQELK